MSLPVTNSRATINESSNPGVTTTMANDTSAGNLPADSNQPESNQPSDDSNILVAIRVRPLLGRELVNSELDIIRAEGSLLVRMTCHQPSNVCRSYWIRWRWLMSKGTRRSQTSYIALKSNDTRSTKSSENIARSR